MDKFKLIMLSLLVILLILPEKKAEANILNVILKPLEVLNPFKSKKKKKKIGLDETVLKWKNKRVKSKLGYKNKYVKTNSNTKFHLEVDYKQKAKIVKAIMNLKKELKTTCININDKASYKEIKDLNKKLYGYNLALMQKSLNTLGVFLPKSQAHFQNLWNIMYQMAEYLYKSGDSNALKVKEFGNIGKQKTEELKLYFENTLKEFEIFEKFLMYSEAKYSDIKHTKIKVIDKFIDYTKNNATELSNIIKGLNGMLSTMKGNINDIEKSFALLYNSVKRASNARQTLKRIRVNKKYLIVELSRIKESVNSLKESINACMNYYFKGIAKVDSNLKNFSRSVDNVIVYIKNDIKKNLRNGMLIDNLQNIYQSFVYLKDMALNPDNISKKEYYATLLEPKQNEPESLEELRNSSVTQHNPKSVKQRFNHITSSTENTHIITNSSPRRVQSKNSAIPDWIMSSNNRIKKASYKEVTPIEPNVTQVSSNYNVSNHNDIYNTAGTGFENAPVQNYYEKEETNYRDDLKNFEKELIAVVNQKSDERNDQLALIPNNQRIKSRPEKQEISNSSYAYYTKKKSKDELEDFINNLIEDEDIKVEKNQDLNRNNGSEKSFQEFLNDLG